MYVLRTAFCYCDQWLRPPTVCQCTDALLCSSVYRHRIDAVQDSMSGWWMRTLKQNSGSREHLSQYHVLMWMHYCRLCILNLCGCCICYTHYCCHTQIHKWTNTSPLPYCPPRTNLVSDTAITVGLFAHSKNMARSRIPEMNWASENHEKVLQLFKQTMSYYCEDEDITDPGKIALKILRGIGNEGLKQLNASGMSDADKKRPDKI